MKATKTRRTKNKVKGKVTSPAPTRGRGRPRVEHKLVKVIAYVREAERKKIARAARAAGARSVSSWAAQILEREAKSRLRTGEIPRHVMEEIFRDAIPDPTGSIRKAVREEHDVGW